MSFFSLGFTESVRHWNNFSLNAFSAFLASAPLHTVSASITCTEGSMPDSVGVEEALAPLQSFLNGNMLKSIQQFPSTVIKGCMPFSQTGERQC